MVVHAFDHSTEGTEAGGSLLARGQTGVKELVPEQPKQHKETLSQKANKTNLGIHLYFLSYCCCFSY